MSLGGGRPTRPTVTVERAAGAVVPAAGFPIAGAVLLIATSL